MPIKFTQDVAEVVPGIKCAAVAAHIKAKDRLDLVLFDLGESATSSCVTTTNALAAAPVILVRKHQALMASRYWIINSGNANAAMGQQGDQDALQVCEVLAQEVGCPVESILPFSTGVIGEPLPVDRIIAAVPSLVKALAEDQWQNSVQGIITTDTQIKLISKTFVWQEQAFIVQGITKGAGMIKPNMATMLGYIATNLRIPQALVEGMLQTAVAQSFNAISVDSDTSTNDCVAFAATGHSDLEVEDGSDFVAFVQECLNQVCRELALQIIKDGEGATKVIEIHVDGAKSIEAAKSVAESIGHSPLVKTACFASDPNWGRILMAIGKAPGADVDPNCLKVSLGGELLFSNGGRVPSYEEAVFAEKMQAENIHIHVDLGLGNAEFTFWTNDLSYDYVKINSDYRS